MIINFIIKFFKNKKIKKIDKKNKMLNELIFFTNFYYSRKYFYCSRKNYNFMLEKLENFKNNFSHLKRIFNKEEKEKINNIFNIFSNAKDYNHFNEEFIKYKIFLLPDNFFTFNNIKLDFNQISSILKEDKINLVVAGAGSGKTTTILGKIKYLVEECNLKESEILVLSYSNKSVNDFKERIEKNLNYNINASTIHGFCYSIINKVNRKKISISDENHKNNTLLFCLENSIEFKNLFSDFISYYCWEENDKDSDTIKQKIVTLKNEVVKSYEEAKIANFFYLNGIKYNYEKKYKFNTATESYVQYKPDFYLTDYDIYWEHFGLNKNYDTKWKNENNKLDENYKKSIDWKIKTHNKNGTKLIQSFSYDFDDINWQQNFKNKLEEYDIPLNKLNLTYEQLKKMIEENKNILKITNMFINLINIYQEYELNQEIIEKKSKLITDEKDKYRINLALKIFFYFLKEYEMSLYNNELIDFSGMIKNSIKYLEKYKNPYKYLIIDEFQDISPLRIKIINKLLLINDIKNFYFVGDDWQSIYGFSGSEIKIFTNFLQNIDTSISFINNTYRNSSQLLEITNNFISKDKSLISKQLKSKKENFSPVKIFEYESDNFGNTNQAKILSLLISDLYKKNKNFDFLILARVNKTKEQLFLNNYFYSENNNEIIHKEFPDAKIKFLTIHSSKGLEADFVFVLNVSNNMIGLPCKIKNDTIYNLFKENTEKEYYNEERRVFYVALTRTKNDVYLLTEKDNNSKFIDELKKMEHIYFNNSSDEKKQNDFIIKNCPICKIKLITNDFYTSCPNYKICNITIKNNDINNTNEICLKCGWIVLLKKGKYGYFHTCINCNCNYKRSN